MMFYKKLLNHNELSSADKIVYSYLISKTLSNINEMFDTDGVFSQEKLFDYFVNDEMYEDISKVTTCKVATAVNISAEQTRRSFKTLNDIGWFMPLGHSSYTVSLFKDIVMTYGFDVDVKNFKPTSIIIFYHYLKHKSKYFNGTIDTWNSKIAEEYNTSLSNVKMMISRLSKEGLVERTEDNKLKIN